MTNLKELYTNTGEILRSAQDDTAFIRNWLLTKLHNRLIINNPRLKSGVMH